MYASELRLRAEVLWSLKVYYRLCPPEIQREEKTVQKAIKDAAKRNDMQSAKVIQFLAIGFFHSNWPVFTSSRNLANFSTDVTNMLEKELQLLIVFDSKNF